MMSRLQLPTPSAGAPGINETSSSFTEEHTVARGRDQRGGLCEGHLAEMRASGLTDATIEQVGIYTAKDGEIAGVLGWQPKGHPWGRGWVIRFDEHFARVKLDFPRHNGRGKPIKYESPRNSFARAYFAPNFAELLENSDILVVTEGEKKSLAITQLGIPCVGLVGVWGWQEKRQRSDTGKAYGPRRMINDLACIAWKNRKVIICFDSDAVDKPQVQLAEWRFAELLMASGASVGIARLPGGADGKVGADDFIIEHGGDKFREVLEAAISAEPPPKPMPMDWARMYIDEYQRVGKGVTIRWHRDQFFGWDGRRYRRIPDRDLQRIALQYLDERGGNARPRLATDVLKCVASEVRISADVEPPAYIGRGSASHPNWLALENGILDLDAVVRGEPGKLTQHTPCWFSPIALPYKYDEGAKCPVWFATLDEIFDGDAECVDMLAEWFGYCLTEDTRLHAILLIEGPRRSGKGTILRTMRAVIGPDNTVSPRLAGLAELFGLWGLLGKRLAICPDAHLGHGDRALATLEILKLISGEDAIEVHRKHLPPITTRLRIRFALAVNELPKFGDSSGALAARACTPVPQFVRGPGRSSAGGQAGRGVAWHSSLVVGWATPASSTGQFHQASRICGC